MNELSEKIRAEIAARGVIPFARFMEMALYCPLYGYYEQETDRIGRRGDYYTSVSVGSLFGELLAFQFAEWLDGNCGARSAECEVEPGDALQIVEAGAHDGKLAADILGWMKRMRPGLFEQLEYWIVEPSPRRREWQAATLKTFAPRVRWLNSKLETPDPVSPPQSALRAPCFNGVIFSNELLDAMPVHRVGWDAKKREWFEWGVTVEEGKLVWTRSADRPVRASTAPGDGTRTSLSAFPDVPVELLDALPDGFTTEVCPAREAWWRRAARALAGGKLLTLDYGLTAEEFFAPGRRDGTLRAYHRQHASRDVLENVGEQDITAHVNFTALQLAGEAEGLKTEAFITQEQLLTRIAEKIWQNPAAFGEWTAVHTRQFQTLTHPQHLGRPFRVLIQSR